MNSNLIKQSLISIVILVLSYHQVDAQKSRGTLSESPDLYNYVLSEYGPDQVLINGLYPEDYILDATGHPFLLDTVFHSGYLVLHHKKFENVYLQYNIFDQNIIVTTHAGENGYLQVIPPNKFVSEFKMDNKLFRKYCFDGANEHYYQVVYDGSIRFLYSYAKKRFVSYNRSKYSTFTFSKEARKSYLLINQKLCEFKNLGSFLQYFPESRVPGIKAYCKKEKINFSRATDQEIEKLMKYCDQEMPKS